MKRLADDIKSEHRQRSFFAFDHFWGATQIVDLYHGLEHLADADKAAFGALNPKSQQWLYRWESYWGARAAR